MGQLVDEITPQYKDKVNLVVVFIDDPKEQDVVDRFNVQSNPTTILFAKDGQESELLVGMVDKAALTAKLDELAK
jgi:thioredoxin-like negative regulator of GroEL